MLHCHHSSFPDSTCNILCICVWPVWPTLMQHLCTYPKIHWRWSHKFHKQHPLNPLPCLPKLPFLPAWPGPQKDYRYLGMFFHRWMVQVHSMIFNVIMMASGQGFESKKFGWLFFRGSLLDCPHCPLSLEACYMWAVGCMEYIRELKERLGLENR